MLFRVYILFIALGIVSLSWAQPEGAYIWVDREAMEQARRGHVAAAYDGEIYVFGGVDNRRTILNTLEIYNPDADSWRSGPPMPRPLYYHAAAVVGDRIFIFGGRSNGDRPVLDILMFNPEAGDRGEYHLVAEMPEPRYGASAAAIDRRRIMVMGGRSSRGNALATGFFFDIDESATTDAPDLHSARANFKLLNYNVPLAIGGINLGHVNSLEVFTNRSWNRVGRMDIPRGHFGAVIYGDTIMVVGGLGQEDRTLRVTSGFIVGERGGIEWRGFQDLRQSRADHTLTVINDDLYAIGGSIGNRIRNVSNEVEMFTYVLPVADDQLPITSTLISAYPNPTNGMLRFSFPYGTKSITVMDIAGRSIIEQDVGKGTIYWSWNTALIPAGSYHFRVESSFGGQSYTGRFVVMK